MLLGFIWHSPLQECNLHLAKFNEERREREGKRKRERERERERALSLIELFNRLQSYLESSQSLLSVLIVLRL